MQVHNDTGHGGYFNDMDMLQVRKRISFAMPFYTKNMIILPRQARDKHRNSTQKRAACSYDMLLQIGQGDLDPAGKGGEGAMARSRSHYTQHLMMKSTLLISTVLSGAAKRDN